MKLVTRIYTVLWTLSLWSWMYLTAIVFVGLFHHISIEWIIVWGGLTILVGLGWLLKRFLHSLVGDLNHDSSPSSSSDSYSYDNNEWTDEEWMKWQAKQEKIDEKYEDFRERHGRDPNFWESIFDL